MHKSWLVPLLFGLGTTLACASASSDIQVIATPVRLPDADATLGEANGAVEPTATALIVEVPTVAAIPASGPVDVYAERTPNGLTLHYADPATDRELATTSIESRQVVLAGEMLFFAGGSGMPLLARPDGVHIPYEVAAPANNADFYEFVFSRDGSTLVWLNQFDDGASIQASIWAAWNNRDAILEIYRDDLPPNTGVRLVGLSADGSTLFFDHRDLTEIESYSAFPTLTDLWALNVNLGEVTHLPGEPACEGNALCSGAIDAEGRLLIRTIHSDGDKDEHIVVTEVTSGQTVAAVAAQPQNEGARFEVGFPLLAPDRERLVYSLAEGPAGSEVFSYFLADLESGAQELVASSGTTPLRPVRWLDDDTLVMSAEPEQFDEWHLETASGQLSRISGRLYLGQVTLP